MHESAPTIRARRAVRWINDGPVPMRMNGFGMASRETGQSRVPDPPQRMIASMLLLTPKLSAPMVAEATPDTILLPWHSIESRRAERASTKDVDSRSADRVVRRAG